MTLFILGTLAILGFLVYGTWRTARLLHYVPMTLNPLLFPAENIVRLALIAMCLLLADISGLLPEQFGWFFGNGSRDLILGLGCGVVVAAILPFISEIAVKVFGPQIYSPSVILRVLPRSQRQWILVPLALVSSVLLEELLFRSLLLGGFSSFAPPLALAVIWSFFFALMHMPQGLLGMIVAGFLGFFLSVLFLATMSLIAPFIAHYLINLLQIARAARDETWLKPYRRSPTGDGNSSSDS